MPVVETVTLMPIPMCPPTPTSLPASPVSMHGKINHNFLGPSTERHTIDEAALWAALQRTNNVFPLPAGLTRIAVPTLINAISGVSKELNKSEFLEYAYKALTGHEVGHKRLRNCIQLREAQLLERLRCAALVDGDFARAKLLGLKWSVLDIWERGSLREGEGADMTQGKEGREVAEEVWNRLLLARYVAVVERLIETDRRQSAHFIKNLLCTMLGGQHAIAEAVISAMGPLETWRQLVKSMPAANHAHGGAIVSALLDAMSELSCRASPASSSSAASGDSLLDDIDPTAPEDDAF